MPYRIVYLDDARDDIRDIRSWYKKQQIGLSRRFSQEVKKAIIRIQNNPEVYAYRYKNIRVVHTAIFPYSIHFSLEEKLITLIAVIHNYRDTESIQTRIS